MSEAKGVTQVNGVKEYKYLAGGEWRSSEGNKLFDVYQPYNRALYARVAAGGRAEAKIAVDAAAKAFPAWSQTTPAERAGLFFKAAEIVKRRRADINSPTVNDEIHAPMGGVRDSGWGRTGPDSLKEFQDVIWINSHSGQRQYPF